MDKKDARALLEKYKSGKLSDAERAQLNAWYAKMASSNSVILEDGEPERNLDEAWEVINEHTGNTARPAGMKLWSRMAVAAAVAVVTLGVWLYDASSRQSLSSKVSRDLYANHIKPGQNTATLRLADGEVIHLDTNRTSVIATDSVKISTLLTASTPRGGTYQVVLPDGTKAWLNAESNISFPSQFSGSKREVSVAGEIYFEVAHNKAKPFIVHSKGQQVEVLGTHFNINAYPEEGSVKTTLLEGSVRINRVAITSSSLRGKRSDEAISQSAAVKLKPNQQSVLSGNKIEVKTINSEEAIAWKDGYFRFNDEKIESIMRKVSRWYNVEVEYRGEITKEGFNGAITRYSSIRDVLEIMEGSKAVHFKIEGRKIIVSK